MGTLSLEIGSVTRIVLNHPPLNLFDAEMQRDLERALDLIEAAAAVRVVVVESALPDYFIAHYDVGAILAEPIGAPRTSEGSFNALMGRIRESPKPTIGKVRGAARGGGCELLLALDMRFASEQNAVFSFPEAALGILAAGGGTQLLPELVGRARALELLLGCSDVDAKLAERYGLINRALPDGALDSFVNRLSRRIAEHPPQAGAMVKLAVGAGESGGGRMGFALEALLLDLLKAQPQTRERMRRFLAAGGQTEAVEADFEALLERLASNEYID